MRIGAAVAALFALAACMSAPIPAPAPPIEMGAPTVETLPTEQPSRQPTVPAAVSTVKLTDGKLVLAIINDQSGPLAEFSGTNSIEAISMAAEDFLGKYGAQALGGPIEIVAGDHQNRPDHAATLAQRLYDQNGADVILDVPTSSAALAVGKVAQEKKRLYVNTTAETADLTGPSCGPYTFHYGYDTFMLAAGTGAAVTRSIGKSWYILYPNHALGRAMNDSFVSAIQANGGTIIASDPLPAPSDTGSLATFLLRAPTLRPDILGVMARGPELINLIRQYNEFKLKNHGMTLAIGLLSDADIKSLGPDAFAGAIYTTPWVWTMDARTREFAKRFKDRTGARPTFAHAGNYSAAFQYLEAVRRAGTDEADAVVSQLEGHSFDDVYIRNGYIRPEDHWVMRDALIARVKPQSEMQEEGDYAEILAVLPAEQASRPLGNTRCKMP